MKQLLLFVLAMTMSTLSFAQPANDECAGAYLVTVDTGQIITLPLFEINTATESAGSTPTCFLHPYTSQNVTVNDVWYKLSLVEAGNLKVLYEPFPGAVALYDACNGNYLGCRSTGGYAPQIFHSFPDLLPGMYHLRIGLDSSRYSNSDPIIELISNSVSNDECATAESFTLTPNIPTTLNRNLIGASSSSDPTNCLAPGYDQWYSFVMPISGLIILDGIVGVFNSSIYDGCNGNEISCAMGYPMFHENLVQGNTYFLRMSQRHDGVVINSNVFNVTAKAPQAYEIAAVRDGTCQAAVDTLIDSVNGNTSSWVPLFDAAGNIIAEVNGNGQNLGTVTCSYWIHPTLDHQNPSPGVRVLARREITINTTNAFANPISIKLYLKNVEFNFWQYPHILKEEIACGVGSSLTYFPIFYPNIQSYGVDYTYEFTVNSLSTFFFAYLPFPISLTHFDAAEDGPINHLTWTTETEENSSHFEVERMDQNGNWQILSQVQANGNSSEELDYAFTDDNPLQISTYRLKMVDIDGSFEYSPVEVVTRTEILDVQIYPNPTTGKIRISIADDIELEEVRVLSSNGALVLTEKSSSLDISDSPRGIYFLAVRTSEGIIHQRIVKH